MDTVPDPVLGGLALPTVLPLFVVPVVFTSLWRMRGLPARAQRPA